jgi:hypothetical protein
MKNISMTIVQTIPKKHQGNYIMYVTIISVYIYFIL